MKRKHLIVIFLVLGSIWVGLKGYLSYLHYRFDPHSESEGSRYADSLRGAPAWADFLYGADQFRKGIGLEKACAELGDDGGLCWSGFLFERSRSGQSDPVPDPLQDLATFSAGMAAADLNRPPPEGSNLRTRALLIDGWAFQMARTNGLKNSLADCGNRFSGPEYRSCLFGLGRASFFWREDLAAISHFPDAMKSGFHFAQALFGDIDDENRYSTPAGRLGRVVRRSFLHPTSMAKSKDRACLLNKHPIECVQ